MISVVSGKAMISPIKPKRAPQTERERSRIAGLSPIALPIIFGVITISISNCTTANTISAEAKIIQKFCPVSAALSNARKAVGISAKVWR